MTSFRQFRIAPGSPASTASDALRRKPVFSGGYAVKTCVGAILIAAIATAPAFAFIGWSAPANARDIPAVELPRPQSLGKRNSGISPGETTPDGKTIFRNPTLNLVFIRTSMPNYYPLNWCYSGNGCGRGVADQYCQLRLGATFGAIQFEKRPKRTSVGPDGATRYEDTIAISSRQLLSERDGHVFTLIVCESQVATPLPRR
jgi:hypothetical protein